VTPRSKGTPSNIVGPAGRYRSANQRERSRCPADSTLTANAPARSIRPTLRLASLRQTSTSIGSSDTDEKELTVMPCMLPSPEATVTTVTPAANEPIASRKALTATARRSCRVGMLMKRAAEAA
jgi:hypothetical protein